MARVPAKHLEQGLEVSRWRCLDLNAIASYGMRKLQASSVQCLPAKVSERVPNRIITPGGHCHATAIDRVANEWVAPVRKVHPDLMSTSGFEFDPYIGMRCKAFEHTVTGDGGLAVINHAHPQPVDRMPPDRGINGPPTGQHTIADGDVYSGYFPRCEHTHERRM